VSHDIKPRGIAPEPRPRYLISADLPIQSDLVYLHVPPWMELLCNMTGRASKKYTNVWKTQLPYVFQGKTLGILDRDRGDMRCS